MSCWGSQLETHGMCSLQQQLECGTTKRAIYEVTLSKGECQILRHLLKRNSSNPQSTFGQILAVWGSCRSFGESMCVVGVELLPTLSKLVLSGICTKLAKPKGQLRSIRFWPATSARKRARVRARYCPSREALTPHAGRGGATCTWGATRPQKIHQVD